MKASATAIIVLALGIASSGHAQESSIVGRYTGNVQFQGIQRQHVPVGMTLTVHKVNDGNIEATGQMTPLVGTCTGEFLMVGKLSGDQLRLRNAKPFGQTGECNLVVQLTTEGTQLVGTTARGLPVRLSK